MKLEQQVVSLELAQQLKNLGVKQESYFSWIISQDKEKRDIIQLRKTDIGIHNNHLYKMYHAYSVAELGEMLPEEIDKREQDYWIYMARGLGGVWQVGYRKNGTDGVYFLQEADTEADARAKMLIYLKENNLIAL